MHTHENHTCTHTHARTRMHAHACTHTHARTHTRMHAHACACTHTHAHARTRMHQILPARSPLNNFESNRCIRLHCCLGGRTAAPKSMSGHGRRQGTCFVQILDYILYTSKSLLQKGECPTQGRPLARLCARSPSSSSVRCSHLASRGLTSRCPLPVRAVGAGRLRSACVLT